MAGIEQMPESGEDDEVRYDLPELSAEQNAIRRSLIRECKAFSDQTDQQKDCGFDPTAKSRAVLSEKLQRHRLGNGFGGIVYSTTVFNRKGEY